MNAIDRRLLDEFQRDFPLCPRPYAAIAAQLGLSEAEVIERLQALQAGGTISRVGPVFAPNRLGVSTLAAMAVPEGRFLEVAEQVNAYPEVNHNYQREHRFNLWFVVTAEEQAHLDAVLADIEDRTGLKILVLPLLKDYHIDLGFRLQWS